MEEKINKIELSFCVRDNKVEKWTDNFDAMIITDCCPNCGWSPTDNDTVISFGPKKYSHVLSMESSFPQYVWCEVHRCIECETIFKVFAETI